MRHHLLYITTYGLCGVILLACSKQQQPLSCDGKNIQFALLDDKITASGAVYFSRNLADFKLNRTNLDKSLTCAATLSLQSNLDKHNVLKLPVTYTVYKVNNDVVSNTSGLVLDQMSQTKMQNWIQALNGLVYNIGDYQLTPYGALYVVKQNKMEQVLFFDGKPVNPQISNYQVNIEKNYTLDGRYVFLIGSYTGGTIDMDTANNRLIQINAQGKYTLTKSFAYRDDGIIQNKTTLYINAIDPGRPFVESGDLPIYSYESGVLKTIHASESDDYYQAKFATIQAKDIVAVAKFDHCFDEEANQLDISHACGYAAKYCFMYKALKEPLHDADYAMLTQVCE